MANFIKDSKVLVVGGSSGIGRATALLFAREGARVMVAARREDRLLGLQEQLREEGFSIDISVADVSNPEAMERLAQQALAKFGNVDTLVYATGTNTPDRAMSRLNVATWDMMLSVNLSGAYYITHALLPSMRQAQNGHLIYISSISGVLGDASGASYQAAKRGLLGLAHATRLEEKENNIRTCVVCPGLVDTELMEKRPVKPSVETLQKALQPEDVAAMVLAVAQLPPRAVVPELQILPATL
ncbi:MAG TPA: SDR family oxidoreductase [Bryobacteraceae bacterium]|nr:SDR family oxidoreductase [Bryobacteraceae bacterium]